MWQNEALNSTFNDFVWLVCMLHHQNAVRNILTSVVLEHDRGAPIQGVPQKMCSRLHPVLAGKLFYFRVLAGKKIADLGLLVFKSIFSDENLRVKRTKEEKVKHLMTFHSSVIVCTCHWTDYDFAGRNFLRLLCWEMDILKRLPGECGTPVCMPATWKMLRKRFFGKVIHCISAKKHTLRYMLVGCSRWYMDYDRYIVEVWLGY